MKSEKALGWSLVLLVFVAAVYRIIPDRPYGFAPQWAIAVFAGAVIKDKKLALAIPVLSMFFSDMFFQILYQSGLSDMPGFYEGQWQNYILFGLLTFIGFAMRKMNIVNILFGSLAAPTAYFILSNFILWAGWSGARGLGRPKNFSGLIQCYNDALPFYRTSLYATFIFSAILFGVYFLLSRNAAKTATIS
ncbi:MAG TPA: DUF6580 family putative transport protein [Puia sp.]|nr:DUF6580 family putative transport protein [Puia sp.]